MTGISFCIRTTCLARELEKEIERLEGKVSGLAERFAKEGYYENTPWEKVAEAERERNTYQDWLAEKLAEWEAAGQQLEALAGGT